MQAWGRLWEHGGRARSAWRGGGETSKPRGGLRPAGQGDEELTRWKGL